MKNDAEKMLNTLTLLREQLDELEKLIEKKAREHTLSEDHLVALRSRLVIEQEILLRGIELLRGGS